MTLLIGLNVSAQNNASFEGASISASESFWNGSDMTGTEDGTGLFTSTFQETPFEFKTVYDTSYGAIYGYWADGWAYSNQTSDTMTSTNGQHSSYAGGASDGSQYAIGKQKSTITKTDPTVRFLSLDVTNTNYAAHSMLNGDFFAKKFGGATGDDPDWFLLTVVGYDDVDDKIDSVEFYLADYRFGDNSQDYIIKDWTTVDLSLVENASYLVLSLTSSDNDPTYGMNTPSFYAVDYVTYDNSATIVENDSDFKLYPNPTSGYLFLDQTSSFNNYQVFSLDGKIVRNGQLTTNMLDLSSLPKGSYYISLIGNDTKVSKPFIKL